MVVDMIGVFAYDGTMKKPSPKEFQISQVELLINKHNLFIVFVGGSDFLLSKDALLNAKITNGISVIPLVDLGVEFLMNEAEADKIAGRLMFSYQVCNVLSAMQCHKIF